MAELKSSYELALEKLRAKGSAEEATLTPAQKEQIAEIRRDLQAKMAEREIMKASRLGKLHERTRPEDLAARQREIEDEYVAERARLEAETEAAIRDVRGGRG